LRTISWVWRVDRVVVVVCVSVLELIIVSSLIYLVLDSFVWVKTTFFIDLIFQKVPQKQKDETFFRQDNRIDWILIKSLLGYPVHPVNPV
jgi:hypothetical protein